MTRNIYDDPAFSDAYSQMSRSLRGLEDAPEWPDLRALVPDLRNLNVVDLGCGYGWFAAGQRPGTGRDSRAGAQTWPVDQVEGFRMKIGLCSC